MTHNNKKTKSIKINPYLSLFLLLSIIKTLNIVYETNINAFLKDREKKVDELRS